MSLDGFIAGPNGEDRGLYDWYFAAYGNAAERSATVIDELIRSIGAMILGRRAYGTGNEQGGFADNPYQVPHFVLSHAPAEPVVQGPMSFTFVTDGIESALTQAKAAAGNKDVCVAGGANIAQQYLRAGLIDEIQLHLVPVLLGEGLRLFDHLGTQPIALERTRVVEGSGVTHLRFRVVR
jgi:dihydrofolate reductase